jgi:nitrate reductase gamma subunit
MDILQANVGFSWASISKPILDILTLIGILGISALLTFRLYAINSRQLSSFSDFFILLILLNIFLSGYIAGRPWNPISYDGLMLYHTLNGMGLLLLIPFSKIAHCVLFPLIRLSTEVAWRFTPQGGSETVKSLHGSQGRKI